MNLVFNHRQMSLMDSHYPRAREFIPERWIVEKNDPLYYGKAHPFVYLPFGFGIRSCIGKLKLWFSYSCLKGLKQ